MVVLIDELQHKGLVQRRPHPDDRRKNVVTLTGAGRITLEKAARADEEAERRFLAAVGGDEAAILKKALRAVASPVIAVMPVMCRQQEREWGADRPG